MILDRVPGAGLDHAPLTVGGVWIDDEKRYGIEIPWMGSLATGNSLSQVVPSIYDIPEDERPPINVTHFAFQAMVGAGTAMVGIAAWFWVLLRLAERLGERLSARVMRRLDVGVAVVLIGGGIAVGWQLVADLT